MKNKRTTTGVNKNARVYTTVKGNRNYSAIPGELGNVIMAEVFRVVQI